MRFVHDQGGRRLASIGADAARDHGAGAITTSAFGPFYRNTSSNTYNDFLPSANLKFDLTDDLCCASPPRRR